MDIIQTTSQDKMKIPAPTKQRSSGSGDWFEKVLQYQEQSTRAVNNVADQSVQQPSAQDPKNLPLGDQKSFSKDWDAEKTTRLSSDSSEYDSCDQKDNNNMSDIRNDMTVVLPFVQILVETQNQDDVEKNFSLALNLDQDNCEKEIPLDRDISAKSQKGAVILEESIVSKASNANEMLVDHIIQSSNIDLKSKKFSSFQIAPHNEEDLSFDIDDLKGGLLEKHLSSATPSSKNSDMMAKIFESSTFTVEQNQQFEELELSKNMSGSQDNTAVTEGQIFFKSDNLGQRRGQTQTPFLTPSRQIEMEIRQAVHKGVHKLEFDLNPLELGKMTVRLNIDAEGCVKALVQAKKFETFELLQRDTTTRDSILKAFDEAGLMADGHSLHFSHQESNARNQSAEDFLMSFQHQNKEEAVDEENSNLIYKSRTDPSRAYDIFA